MPTWITEVLSALMPYWPAVAQVLVLWYLGQVFKKRVFTKANASTSRFYREMRATLPFHPVAAGAIWGMLYPWLPAVSFVTTRGGAINEGFIAGVSTVMLHTGLEYYAAQQVAHNPESAWGAVLKVLRDAVPEVSADSCVPPSPGAN